MPRLKRIPFIFFLIINQTFAQIPEKSELISFKRTPEPFLFSTTTLTPGDLRWSLDYSTSYGERVSEPFGSVGLGQQFGVKGYLGSRFTLVAHAAFGYAHEKDVTSAQQVEIIRDLVGGNKQQGLRFGLGLGAGRDFSNVTTILSRFTVSYDANRWNTGGNILLEKSFAGYRDKIDVITSFGFHYRFAGNFYGGFETVGEDLEGFWDKEEAEGGAKLLVGPSLNMITNHSRLSFSISGGPVFYATRNEAVNLDPLRELPSQPGLTLRAKISYNLSK